MEASFLSYTDQNPEIRKSPTEIAACTHIRDFGLIRVSTVHP